MLNLQLSFKMEFYVPVDSHFPIEKFKAVDDAYQADDKKAAGRC